MKAFCLVASVVDCGQLCLAESSTVTFSSSSSSSLSEKGLDGFFSSATGTKSFGKDSAELETVAKPRVIMISFESFAKVPTNDCPSSFSIYSAPMWNTKGATRGGGFRASYAVLANSILGIEDVKVTSIVGDDGKELSKLKSGNPAWKFVDKSFFGSAANNVAQFEIQGRAMTFGRVQPKITGSVEVKVAGERKTEKVKAKVSDGDVTIAGIKFKLSYGSNSMTMFSDDDKAEQQLKVEFSDPEGVIVDLKALVGGKPLSQSGSSMMNAKKSYFFNKPSDEVTLAVTYAQGVKTLTLPL